MNDVQRGDRIRLLEMGEDPCQVDPGTTGLVRRVASWGPGDLTVIMHWDNGRTLGLVCPPDRFEIIERPRSPFFDRDPA
jgi:hypothetical protein